MTSTTPGSGPSTPGGDGHPLADHTVLSLAAAVRAGEISPREVLDATLDAIARVGPRVGAFVAAAQEASTALAHDQARAAEERLLEARRDGTLDALPPLLGVPVPVKDLVQVAGVPFGAGSRALDGYVAPVDDGLVGLLRDAGTLMVGKTATPELGMPPYTEPDTGPPARTPWDLSRSAGGSSGGAAAAVAARIVPAAHGNDGGGSIRIPASACGLVGHKPSRGLVSTGPYGVDGPGLAANGALTRTVRDTAVLLDVLAVPQPGDTYTPPRLPVAGSDRAGTFLAACDVAPRRLRVGVLTAPVIVADAPVDPACVAAAERAAATLTDLGHDVVVAPVPFPAERWAAFEALWSVGALSAPVPPEAEPLLVPLTRWLREKGRTASGLEVARASSAVQEITREAAVAWAGFDVVLTPTLARLPAPVGSMRDDLDPAADFRAQMSYTPWTSVANLTGRPSISLPLGWATGPTAGTTLPVGVMLTGVLGGDATLLSLAAQLEATTGWADRLAPVHA
ncbi:amidase [Sediminihabitans luteus]|uniref:Amidase n=1 Tax=Sediminihabitans luteus TaxID=1138585 RepID=A0A2M9CYN8_9CELL|nr:amidase [Sediminihabitans luteus]PJJ77052.1 amidase [Sediminihabitans luteus]GIJ00429.1 amidase [Sediminihabitans luteus]